MKKLAYYPIGGDSSRALYFQDIDRSTGDPQLLPDFFASAKLDGVKCHDLVMRTYNVDGLTTHHLTAAALAGVGIQNRQMTDLLQSSHALVDAQRQLGGTVVGRNSVAPNLVGLSFWRGAFVADEHAACKKDAILKPLETSHHRDTFLDIVTCVASGMSNEQVAARFGKAKWWADDALFELKVKLCATPSELVMIVGGLGLLTSEAAPADARP